MNNQIEEQIRERQVSFPSTLWSQLIKKAHQSQMWDHAEHVVYSPDTTNHSMYMYVRKTITVNRYKTKNTESMISATTL